LCLIVIIPGDHDAEIVGEGNNTLSGHSGLLPRTPAVGRIVRITRRRPSARDMGCGVAVVGTSTSIAPPRFANAAGRRCRSSGATTGGSPAIGSRQRGGCCRSACAATSARSRAGRQATAGLWGRLLPLPELACPGDGRSSRLVCAPTTETRATDASSASTSASGGRSLPAETHGLR
jgi:hypothetical protein